MANSLKQLADIDLDFIRHMIRRDSYTDLMIAEEAEKRLKRKLAETDAAKRMVVARYRDGADYKRWLARWENQDQELKKAVALQKQRFEFLSNLVKDEPGKGLENVSKALQARLLTLAAELPDDALATETGPHGWVKNVIRLVQNQAKIAIAAAVTGAEEVATNRTLSDEEKRARIRELFKKAKDETK